MLEAEKTANAAHAAQFAERIQKRQAARQAADQARPIGIRRPGATAARARAVRNCRE